LEHLIMLTITRLFSPALPARCTRQEIALRCRLTAFLALVTTCLLVALEHSSAANVPDEALAKIEAALPESAWAAPKKPRRLLIYDADVGYDGHASADYANLAFLRMGVKTGAYATELSSDPEVFRRTSLSRFDAVFFNNTVGNLFTDSELRENLQRFVLNGGGMIGVHGTAVAFTQWPGAIEDWPEFGRMLGGRGANHRDSDERVFVRVEDPTHPLTAMFPSEGFVYRDEFFRVHAPYSRDQLRVLLSFDTEKTDMSQGPARGNCTRADNDYAIAWCRSYGKGRTFYCTIAHNPYVFWDPSMLKFYLAAVQFALGDLDASTPPSAQLTGARP
jgi:type 1 glutamine amidotransferase